MLPRRLWRALTRHDLFWDQGVAPEGLLDTDTPVVEELVLRTQTNSTG